MSSRHNNASQDSRQYDFISCEESTLRELYYYGLENHIITAIQQITRGTLLFPQNKFCQSHLLTTDSGKYQQLYRLASGSSETILHIIRETVKSCVCSQSDDFIDFILKHLSEVKEYLLQKQDEWASSKKQLLAQLKKVKTQAHVEAAPHYPSSPNHTSSSSYFHSPTSVNSSQNNTKEFEANLAKVTSFFTEQLQEVEKKLLMKQTSEKQLSKAIQNMKLKQESEERKYTRKVRDLEEQLAQAKKEKSMLTTEVQSLNELIKRFERDNDQYLQTVTQKKDELAEVKKMLKEERQASRDFSIDSKRNFFQDQRIKQLEVQLTRKEQTIREMEKLRMDLTDKCATAKVQAQTALAKADVLQGYLKDKEQEIQRLRQEIERLKVESDKKSEELANVRLHTEQQKRLYERQKRQTQQMRLTNEHFMNDLNRSRHEKEEIIELDGKKEEFYETQIRKLLDELKGYDGKLFQLQTQLSEQKQHYERKVNDLERLNIQLMKNLDRESIHLTTTIDTLHEQNKGLKEAIRELEEECETMKKQLKEQEQRLAVSVGSLEQEQNSNKQMRKTVQILTSELEIARQKNKEHNQILQQWQRKAQEANEALAELQEQNNMNAIHHNKIELRFKSELQNIQSELEIARLQNRTLEAKVGEVTLQLTKNKQSEQEIEQLKKSHEKELIKFKDLLETLKKKYSRKIQLMIKLFSRIKNTIHKLGLENRNMRDNVQLELQKTTVLLDRHTREVIARFKKEIAEKYIPEYEHRKICTELLDKIDLLRLELGRLRKAHLMSATSSQCNASLEKPHYDMAATSDQENFMFYDQTPKQDSLQATMTRNSPQYAGSSKNSQHQVHNNPYRGHQSHMSQTLKKNTSCSQLRGTVYENANASECQHSVHSARRTGFESLKMQIMKEQRKLYDTLNNY